MHESALARAALPAPTICLGMLLRPYSLGHELWLIRENCAILRGSPDGLATAVLICCQSWTQLQTMRSDWLLGLKLWLWRRRIKRASTDVGFQQKATKKTKAERPAFSSLPSLPSVKSYLHRETQTFLEYRNAGLLEFPASEIIDPDSSASRSLGAPFVLRLQQWLMTHFHLTEAQAWDYPAGLAKMRWATHWESEGAFKIKNASESEFDQFISQSIGGKL
jgi:hypothetical protein